MVLTDGCSYTNPANGVLNALKDYKDMYPTFAFQCNTFGFGYSLDSELLLAIAKEANGTFGFIPDGLIVGTNFISSMANCMSTYSNGAILRLIPQSGAAFSGPVLGGLDESQESWGR